MGQVGWRVAAALAGLTLASCGCSSVGCTDEVQVQVVDAAGNPAPAFFGQAYFGTVTIPFLCDEALEPGPGFLCTAPGEVRFYGVRPVAFAVSLQAPDGPPTTQTLRPSPEDSEPNGERCGAGCQLARVSVQLP
ncbi:hypothetical protein FGE12_10090 [Aggregicoccus sp. 17bor-14]|uniref:hypothetical protein n=1 Tax=Myxococcaceae TaxID=31 RepID=UPI00129C933A|nr:MULTISPECIES: hypothetical protein [Myxococcaceae]MBF5042750.1 hypothetical protein [Simulacricoccus sp. 17bor-14]MRI88518.1 hypothetical protein [Aggregicoccus sp. 17bor-14]